MPVPYLASDGTPTDPATPDTEISIDGADPADCAEEVTTVGGSADGLGFITFTGAEMNCSLALVQAKVASGPKTTLAMLTPRVLPVIATGTAQGGANGSITLAAGTAALNLAGCIVRTTGGTGGGGTGGANNQARVITAFDTATKVATVVPNWETNPSSDTTYDILRTENSGPYMPTAAAGATSGLSIVGSQMNLADGAVTAAKIASDAIANAKIADGAITAAKIATDAIANAKIADGAVTAAKIATDAITNAKIADGLLTAAKLATAALAQAKFAADAKGYMAQIRFNRDEANSQDEYTVSWYRMGAIVPAGSISSPTIELFKRDGTNLKAQASLTQVGTLDVYKLDVTSAGERVSLGDDVIVVVTASIDSGTRSWTWVFGRDSTS